MRNAGLSASCIARACNVVDLRAHARGPRLDKRNLTRHYQWGLGGTPTESAKSLFLSACMYCASLHGTVRYDPYASYISYLLAQLPLEGVDSGESGKVYMVVDVAVGGVKLLKLAS